MQSSCQLARLVCAAQARRHSAAGGFASAAAGRPWNASDLFMLTVKLIRSLCALQSGYGNYGYGEPFFFLFCLFVACAYCLFQVCQQSFSLSNDWLCIILLKEVCAHLPACLCCLAHACALAADQLIPRLIQSCFGQAGQQDSKRSRY